MEGKLKKENGFGKSSFRVSVKISLMSKYNGTFIFFDIKAPKKPVINLLDEA